MTSVFQPCPPPSADPEIAADATPARSDVVMPEQRTRSNQWRESLRDQALQNAMQKRAAGVPTYSVPEAAALLSISQEYLYRLIQAGGFPAVRMRLRGNQGRYVIPAKAVEKLLDDASSASALVELDEWAAGPAAGVSGGVA